MSGLKPDRVYRRNQGDARPAGRDAAAIQGSARLRSGKRFVQGGPDHHELRRLREPYGVDEVGVSQPLVLVTGATGFVGTALCVALSSGGYRVRRAVRASSSAHISDAVVGNIDGDTAWKEPLDGVDTVVHLAARTHLIDDRAEDPLAAYRRINVDATSNLFDQAIEAGVRRFILMSSIKVNGEETL